LSVPAARPKDQTALAGRSEANRAHIEGHYRILWMTDHFFWEAPT
jgi:hypothetical protein